MKILSLPSDIGANVLTTTTSARVAEPMFVHARYCNAMISLKVKKQSACRAPIMGHVRIYVRWVSARNALKVGAFVF